MRDSSQLLLRSLLADGVVAEKDVKRAQEHATSASCTLIESLVAINAVTTRMLAISLAKTCEYPFVDISSYDIDLAHASRLPRAQAERLGVFPLFVVDGVSTVAMIDPLNLQAIDLVRQHLKTEVDPVVCDVDQLRALIARAYSLGVGGEALDATAATGDRDLTTGEEPVVAATHQILVLGIQSGASDIHINPDEHELHLRYRVDGVLVKQQGPFKSLHAGIVQRLKVMAKLDLTQTRKPQDGKFRILHDTQPVDFRLSLVPTIHGENAVLRIQRPSVRISGISDLQMSKEVEKTYSELIRQPHGIILVTGPTGSGKTTTLYAALAAVNTPDRNIITIEDPVELRLPMVRQIQVNAEIGLTFSSALRSILRQDPDVVLVGEIRDQETARIALQAAMTGHLVLSTLHTNDSVGAIARLRDFDVPAFSINQGLLGALAQRLVRRICEKCAAPDSPPAHVLSALGIRAEDAGGLRRGAGCNACLNTGYRGRVGVFEMMKMTLDVQRTIEQNSALSVIREAALQGGYKPMIADAVAKARRGMTTVDEVGKVNVCHQADPIEPALGIAA
ncbi:MAG: type II/IV secretion system protein [Phycisphaerales bacterium]|nr:type II/IV secretion system protein [Phycisphaerales bacterium]